MHYAVLSQNDMKTVANFPDLPSARLAQSLLAAEGIDAEIPDEFLSGIDWRMGTALHGVRLRVAPEDEQAAREILATGPEIEETEVPAGEPSCPRCGSTNFGPPAWKRRVKALTLLAPWLLIFYPLVALAPRNACYACGHRWSGKDTASDPDSNLRV